MTIAYFFSIEVYVPMSFVWNVGWLLFQGDNKQPQTAFESIATVVAMQLNLLKI